MKYRFDYVGPPYALNIYHKPLESSSFFEANDDESATNHAEWLISKQLRFVTSDGARRGRATQLVELSNPPRVVKTW